MENSENQEIGNRLKTIFLSLGTTPKKVAESLGVTPSRIHNLTLGYSLPSFLTVSSLLELYPNINLEYLFTGVGYPLKSNGVLSRPSSVSFELPYYENESSFVSEPVAGYNKRLPVMVDGLDLTDCIAFDVLDNSMSPQLHRGQKVIIKPEPIEKWDWLRSGVYVVKYASYAVIRRIKQNDLRENGKLVLYADNDISGAIHLKRADILAIYLVIQVVGSVE